ncbi:MAG TPA: ATP-grasp domain-containing protein [Gemmatimonadaceae bacterium]|nr:ATP-grasp domain-containing protein [Gemmatimonadaceae bacterium]
MLVTDGEHRSALATVRSLGRAGFDVHVAASTARSLAGASRAAGVHLTVPSALDDPTSFAEVVRTHVAAHRIAVVIPTTEAAALALLAAPERLAPAIIPMPDLATFRAISDKAALMSRAAAAGIAAPPQCEAPDPESARHMAADLTYPIVLKPSRSVAEHNGVRVKLGVKHAADRAQLDAHLAALPRGAYPLLLQQRIVGPGVGVFLLRWDDETIATFTHRRIREKPPSGGVSVYAESTAPDPDLVERAEGLLRACAWRGVAMVELKLDARTNTPYLMEINGRFWGSLQLAIDAGVDFPAILVRRALGDEVRGPDRWKAGVRGRWFWGDVDHLITRLRRSDAALALPPDAPSRSRVVSDFMVASFAGARDQVFRWADPRPFLFESRQWLTRSA